MYAHVLAEAVDAMPDVEDEGQQPEKGPEEPEETHAEKVARQLLENLPAEVREALGRLSGEQEVRQP